METSCKQQDRLQPTVDAVDKDSHQSMYLAETIASKTGLPKIHKLHVLLLSILSFVERIFPFMNCLVLFSRKSKKILQLHVLKGKKFHFLRIAFTGSIFSNHNNFQQNKPFYQIWRNEIYSTDHFDVLTYIKIAAFKFFCIYSLYSTIYCTTSFFIWFNFSYKLLDDESSNLL